MEKRVRTGALTTGHQPRVALTEFTDHLLVKIEWPGVKATEIDVHCNDNAVVIRPCKTIINCQNPTIEGRTPVEIIGSSPNLQACVVLAKQAACDDRDILIAGETGTGKELIARFIHQYSWRSGGNFVVVDCTTTPLTLMQTLLLDQNPEDRRSGDTTPNGLLRQAHLGTLYLDDIGELPPVLQKKFLKLLCERQSGRRYSFCHETFDIRLVGGCRHNLLANAAGIEIPCRHLDFDVHPYVIELPPLRDRNEDFGALCRYFLDTFCQQYHLPDKQMTPEFLLNVSHYNWPGNVHELKTVLEQVIFNAQSETMLFPKHLPVNVRVQATRALWQTRHRGAPQSHPRRAVLPRLQDMREKVFSHAEQQYLHNLMTMTGRNIEQACELSGLSRSRLYTLLKKHQITAQ